MRKNSLLMKNTCNYSQFLFSFYSLISPRYLSPCFYPLPLAKAVRLFSKVGQHFQNRSQIFEFFQIFLNFFCAKPLSSPYSPNENRISLKLTWNFMKLIDFYSDCSNFEFLAVFFNFLYKNLLFPFWIFKIFIFIKVARNSVKFSKKIPNVYFFYFQKWLLRFFTAVMNRWMRKTRWV